MHQVKIFGPGCPNCEKTAKLVQEAATESGAEIQMEKITDFQEIAQHGVFSTPAVAVDGQVKVTGRVPSKKEIIAWIS